MTSREPALDPMALLVDAIRDFAVAERGRTGREPRTRLFWDSYPERGGDQHNVVVQVDGVVVAAAPRDLVHEAIRACLLDFKTWQDDHMRGGE